MPTVKHVEYCLNEETLNALRKKLVTPEEISRMPTVEHLKYYLAYLTAPGAKPLTFEQAAGLPSAEHFAFLLLNEQGIDEVIKSQYTSYRPWEISHFHLPLPSESPEYFLSEGQINPLVARQITLEQAVQMSTAGHLAYFLLYLHTVKEQGSPYQGLITAQQAAKMPTAEHLQYLVTEKGLEALKKNLVTREQAAQMPEAAYLKYLLGEWGLNALEKDLITPEQAAKMPTAKHLQYLFSGEPNILGKQNAAALAQGLITLKRVASRPIETFMWLFEKEKIVDALEKGVITSELIINVGPTFGHLSRIFMHNEWGLYILENHLLTFEELASMPTPALGMDTKPPLPPCYLMPLLTEEGAAALKRNLFTAKEFSEMPTVAHAKYLLKKETLDSLANKKITVEQIACMSKQEVDVPRPVHSGGNTKTQSRKHKPILPFHFDEEDGENSQFRRSFK